MNGTFEPFDRFRLAFRRHFDPAVREVAHPAEHAFPAAAVSAKYPADALHVPADQMATCDPHAKRAIISAAALASIRGSQ
jgi:hypothetical protein